jgi:inosine-uridine nucleoside N-ribohydrolase
MQSPCARLRFVVVLALFVLTAAASPARLMAQAQASPDPVRLIFDTDMGNDVDDAMALAVIHTLETRGVCKLLAVTITKDHPKAGPFVDAINTFYNRGDISIGVVRGGVTPEPGRFLKLIDDASRYPHDLRSNADAPDAVEVLRRTLAAQPDGSVTLVQVGFFTNFARLLASPADAISPLTGRDLIAKKVAQLSVMAGSFQPIKGEKRFLEYNVKMDVPAAQRLVKEWPTPIVWSGFEVGVAAPYPHQSIQRDFAYVPHHLIKDAYYAYEPPPHDRPTWDLTAVLTLFDPDARYFARSATGRVDVATDGHTSFAPSANGRDRYLTITPTQSERVREAFIWLTSTPPMAVRRPGQ